MSNNSSSTEPQSVKKKKGYQMPHTFVIIGAIVLICALLTYVIPAGEYDRAEDPNTGRMVVVPGSYHQVESNPATPMSTVVAIQRGMISASNIIFFIFFAYGFVYVMLHSGAMEAGIGTLLRATKSKTTLLIPLFMLIFGVLGSTIGILEEVYGLIPVFMGIFLALHYDALLGGAVLVIGACTGFSAATTNAFNIGVAQGIAGIPLFSGLALRIGVFVVFMAAAIIYTMRYGAAVRADPSKSHVIGVDFSHIQSKSSDEIESLKLTKRQIAVLAAFFAIIALVLVGTLKFGWYIDEIAGIFIAGTILIGLIGGNTLSQIMELFIKAAGSVVLGALVVGLARAVLIVMQDAQIIDTVVYFLASLLEGTNKYVAGVGMVLVQNIIDFFIPSGSAQAATTMPIMLPIGDMMGLSPQITVLAFQLGAGFSDMFWPTAVATCCGIMGIPLNKWYKFMGPLFVIFLALQIITMLVAVAIGYA